MGSKANTLIKIEPSILVWARESLGLSVEEVARRIKKPLEKVEEWESGKSLPTFPQLEDLAYNIYKRPLAVFFLKAPPEEISLQQDFRTMPTEEIEKLSSGLRLTLRRAKYLQFTLKEMNDGKNPVKSPLHKVFQLVKKVSPEQTALQLRDYLQLNLETQSSWRSHQMAFQNFRNALEENGIFVFQFPIKGDVRGFSLDDPEFPIIGIKSSDAIAGKIFTMFHELCHIFFNTGGIFRDFDVHHLKGNAYRIEVFCNKFAAEFLVPTSLFLQEKSLSNSYKTSGEWPASVLSELANKYKVSQEVILRKILDQGWTDQAFYNEMRAFWKSRHEKQIEKRKEQEGGPTYYKTKISHLGRNYLSLAFESYSQGKISENQLSDFTGVKINKFGKLQEEL